MSDFETESIEWMFNNDVREKKRIAHQAKHRKIGSRSKKCTFSIDHLSHKQWAERCGETVTYNLKKPISWEDFCKLPVHIQKEYLLNLIQEYQTTASDLAKMFGITAQTVTKYCRGEEIDIHFSPGKRMSKENRKAFNEFCGWSDSPQEEVVVAHKAEEPAPTAEDNTPADPGEVIGNTPSHDMAMTDFTLSFSGGFDRDMVCNSISTMVPSGTPVKMTIQCFIMKQDS